MKLLYATAFILLSGAIHAQDSVSVLFIGNSYTYFNDLPLMVSDLAVSLGDEVTYNSQTAGGATLSNHAGNPAVYSAINAQPWDFVVLQAQSQEPSFPDGQVDTQTIPYAVQIADSVYANNFCSEMLMFMTWGRENGDPQWAPISTFEGMNDRLRSAYMRMADSVQGSVGAVGSAWRYVRENYPTIDLYTTDGSHPSYEGSYLAACTFYASMFRKSPIGASFIGSVSPADAANLQYAASISVLDSLDQWNLRPISEHTNAEFSSTSSDPTIDFTNLSTKATSYVWDFGDSNTSTDEHPSHTYSTNGNYTVTLIAESPCDLDTVSYQVNVNAVSLAHLDHLFGLGYQGNGKFTIATDDKIQDIIVYDQMGRRVNSVVLEGDKTIVDLSTNPFGVYVLHVYTESGILVRKVPYLVD